MKRNEELQRENERLREALKALEVQLASSEQEREILARLLANLRSRSFARTSEKLEPGQLTFDFVGKLVEEAENEVEEEIEEESSEAKRKRRPKRRKPDSIPESIARERVVLDVAPELRVCSCCHSELHRIGEDVTTELDYVPARFVAREYVRPKYACKLCEEGVIQEALPARPINKGLPGLGLLTQVLVAKFVEHMPLYRQEKAFKRQGVELPRSTLCDWVQAMATLLLPIWQSLKREVLESSVIQADETPVVVLDRRGAKKGYLWTYGIPWEDVVFDFAEGRSGTFAEEFLKDYEGHVQCDGYSGYDGLDVKRIVRLGCWAHARRRFYEARSESRTAKVALASIQSLYRVEREARAEGLRGDELVAFRREHAGPTLEKLKGYLEERRAHFLPKSLTGDAIGYTLNQWSALERYLEVPLAEIDNNGIENAIRPVALGRKNWLFVGHRNAGPRAATMLSLVGTCLRLRIDPADYLRDVIEKMAQNPSRAEELTPRRWRSARESGRTDSANTSSVS